MIVLTLEFMIHNSRFIILPRSGFVPYEISRPKAAAAAPKKGGSRSGFTLIELLVSMMITMLLSGFIITYTSGGRAQTTLYVEQAKLGQLVSRAKSLSISTYNKSDG